MRPCPRFQYLYTLHTFDATPQDLRKSRDAQYNVNVAYAGVSVGGGVKFREEADTPGGLKDLISGTVLPQQVSDVKLGNGQRWWMVFYSRQATGYSSADGTAERPQRIGERLVYLWAKITVHSMHEVVFSETKCDPCPFDEPFWADPRAITDEIKSRVGW